MSDVKLDENVECFGHCDFENPVHKARATWCCPNCGRDYSLEYLFYYEATHSYLEKQ